MKYTVRVFAVVRIPIEVEADSQAQALSKADEIFLSQPDRHIASTQSPYADDNTGYTVDEEGDEEYRNTKHYDTAQRQLN